MIGPAGRPRPSSAAAAPPRKALVCAVGGVAPLAVVAVVREAARRADVEGAPLADGAIVPSIGAPRRRRRATARARRRRVVAAASPRPAVGGRADRLAPCAAATTRAGRALGDGGGSQAAAPSPAAFARRGAGWAAAAARARQAGRARAVADRHDTTSAPPARAAAHLDAREQHVILHGLRRRWPRGRRRRPSPFSGRDCPRAELRLASDSAPALAGSSSSRARRTARQAVPPRRRRRRRHRSRCARARAPGESAGAAGAGDRRRSVRAPLALRVLAVVEQPERAPAVLARGRGLGRGERAHEAAALHAVLRSARRRAAAGPAAPRPAPRARPRPRRSRCLFDGLDLASPRRARARGRARPRRASCARCSRARARGTPPRPSRRAPAARRRLGVGRLRGGRWVLVHWRSAVWSAPLLVGYTRC